MTLVGYGPREDGGARRRRRRPDVTVAGAQASFNLPPATAPHPAPEPAAVDTTPEPVAPAVDSSSNGRHRVPGGGHRPLAKPPVRKLAKTLGVDLATVTPTGPNGTVTRDDVQAALQAPSGAAAPAPVPIGHGGCPRDPHPDQGRPQAHRRGDGGLGVHRPARHRVRHRRRHRDDGAAGPRRRPARVPRRQGLAAAVRRQGRACWPPPARRRSTRPGTTPPARSCSSTTSTSASPPRPQRGLIVPNIRDAQQLSLLELAQAITELTETARAGRTTPEAMSGGTFTITNVGVFGVDTGTPILNPGESGILAFGAVRRMPWVVGHGRGRADRAALGHPAGGVLRPPHRRRPAGLALPGRRRGHAVRSRSGPALS